MANTDDDNWFDALVEAGCADRVVTPATYEQVTARDIFRGVTPRTREEYEADCAARCAARMGRPRRCYISGRWYRDGYRGDRGRLLIEVVGGIAYDPDQACAPREETEIRITSQGELTAWLHASFAADTGEIDRLERAGVTFRAAE